MSDRIVDKNGKPIRYVGASKDIPLPSERFWNNAKAMTTHWENTIRADERSKCEKEGNRKMKKLEDQELGVATDCDKHEQAGRADEREKVIEELMDDVAGWGIETHDKALNTALLKVMAWLESMAKVNSRKKCQWCAQSYGLLHCTCEHGTRDNPKAKLYIRTEPCEMCVKSYGLKVARKLCENQRTLTVKK